MMKLAGESLNGCSGCEIALLDLGERFFELLETVELVHLPILMDQKHVFEDGGENRLSLPKADLGLVSGGVRTTGHLEVLYAMRRACRTLVAVGTCATHGGIPSLINAYSPDEVKAGVLGRQPEG